jgi:very-short-patch-repair endonuclease
MTSWRKTNRKCPEMMGKNNPMSNPIHVRNAIRNQNIFPTNIEKILINGINLHQLPFEYVGNGTLIVDNRCPDFVSTDNSKIILEVMNDLPQFEEKLPVYLKYGYRVFRVSTHHLRRDLESVILQIELFQKCSTSIGKTIRRCK